MESYTEALRFSARPSSSSSDVNANNKRRKSTGIMKNSTNTAQNGPSASSSPAKKKRRNVSFGGAHVRVFEKANATSAAMPSPIKLEVHLEEDEEAAKEHDNSINNDECTMDFTRSFNAPIVVEQENLNIPIPSTIETTGEQQQQSTGSVAPTEQEDVEMDFTRSYVFDIIQAGQNELTSDLPNYANMSDKTKEVAAMFRGILQNKDGAQVADEEDEDDEIAFKPSAVAVPAAASISSSSSMNVDDDDEDEITFKASSEQDAPSDDVTMDLTRSYTSKIITQQAIKEATEEITQDEAHTSQEECTMDFTRSFTTAITVNPAAATAVPSAGFLSPLRFPGGAAEEKGAPTPAAVPQVAPVVVEAPNSDEVTMEFTRSFTTNIERATKRASLLPSINHTSTMDITNGKFPMLEEIKQSPQKEIEQAPVVVKQQPIIFQQQAPATPAPIAAASIVASAVKPAAPVPAAAAAPSFVWPPNSLQAWLECYFIDAFDMEDVQAACLHLIDATDSCHELMKKMEEWIQGNEAGIPLFQFIKSMTNSAQAVAQLKQGKVVSAEGNANAKLVAISQSSVQFNERVKVESLTVWNEWRYKLVELSYQRLLDAQTLMQKDYTTVAQSAAACTAQQQTLDSMLSEEKQTLRASLEANAKKIISIARDFQALKVAQSDAFKQQQAAQENLHKRVLVKAQELSVKTLESDLIQLQQITGVQTKALTNSSLKLGVELHHQHSPMKFELDIQWNAEGAINTPAVLTPIQLEHASKDAAFFQFMFQQFIQPSLTNILKALTHRKQIAIVLPHIIHVLNRMVHVKEEITELQKKFNVRTNDKGFVEVTITRVDTMAQVIVNMHGEQFLQQQASSKKSSSSSSPFNVQIIARPTLPQSKSADKYFVNDLSVEFIHSAIQHCVSEQGVWGRASKLIKRVHEIIGPIERV